MGKNLRKKLKPKGWRGETGVNFKRGTTPEVPGSKNTPKGKSFKGFTPNPESYSKQSIDALREQIIANARRRVAMEEKERDEAYERAESEREGREARAISIPKLTPNQQIRQDLLEHIFSGRGEIIRLRNKILKPDNVRREEDMDDLRLLQRKQKGFIEKFNTLSNRLNLPDLQTMNYRAEYRAYLARVAAEAKAEEARKAEEKQKAAAARKNKNGNAGKKK